MNTDAPPPEFEARPMVANVAVVAEVFESVFDSQTVMALAVGSSPSVNGRD
jgi:hypothetical protein